MKRTVVSIEDKLEYMLGVYGFCNMKALHYGADREQSNGVTVGRGL